MRGSFSGKYSNDPEIHPGSFFGKCDKKFKRKCHKWPIINSKWLIKPIKPSEKNVTKEIEE